MDDPNIFTNFLNNVIGNTPARSTQAITNFITTFNDLLTTTESELDSFVKTTHDANSARTAQQKIIIQPQSVISLKAILFELKDRQRCGVLPNADMINAITMEQLIILRQTRSTAIEFKSRRSTSTQASTITIPKLTEDNYDQFHAAFTNLASRTIGINELPLDYLLRTIVGNYNSQYPSREAKLKACIVLRGDNFRTDSEHLYSMLNQHIGTTGVGSTFIHKYHISRNGYNCFRDIDNHFNSHSFKQNKASRATAALSNAVYQGDRRNFNIETYYSIMTTNFNALVNSGPDYALTEIQKIQKFEEGIKEVNAIKYCIDAKKDFDTLPPDQRTFDEYYNLFSAALNKYITMTGTSSNRYNMRSRTNNNSFIRSTSTTNNTNNPQGRGGRGRGSYRGRGRGRHFNNRGRGRHGRGFGGRHNNNRYNPGGPTFEPTNSFASTYGNFSPQAKLYSPDVYRNLTPQQKHSVESLKSNQGWINSYTPPPGFTIDQNTGLAIPSNAIVSAIRTATINQTSTSDNPPSGGPPSIIQLPPPPIAPIPPPPPPNYPNPNQGTSQAGSSFGRQGQRQAANDTASIGMVSINGQNYNGKIYDSMGNALN